MHRIDWYHSLLLANIRSLKDTEEGLRREAEYLRKQDQDGIRLIIGLPLSIIVITLIANWVLY